MVEQWTENPCVPGSILGPATSNNELRESSTSEITQARRFSENAQKISGLYSDLAKAVSCGSSSGVEHNLAKVGVAGSNPVFRSK